ncbi:MAG TPA: class I SAM-dependent rRNA methyltransferase, partial [Cyclobacteriaceae bacterium]|nr:class I SAM-dependent rRNA methyltransferase [Cyclobacteriaceae bacterium]
MKKGKEIAVLRKHPWIFSGAIHHTEGNPTNGDWVEVISADKQTLGFGHYQQGSITVRILTFADTVPS